MNAMTRCSTLGFLLATTAASVLAVGPDAFANAHRPSAVPTSIHDANGSLTSKNRTGADPMSAAYTYNLENRLAAAAIIRIEDGRNVSLTSSYACNRAGIRVRATSSVSVDGGAAEQTNRLFLVDSNNLTGFAQVLEEHAVAGRAPAVQRARTNASSATPSRARRSAVSARKRAASRGYPAVALRPCPEALP